MQKNNMKIAKPKLFTIWPFIQKMSLIVASTFGYKFEFLENT